MALIIDCHVHMSNQLDPVWRKSQVPFTAERVLKSMDGPYLLGGRLVKIDVGVTQPAIGSTIYQAGGRSVHAKLHEYIVESVKRFPTRLLGCMTLNPRIGVDEGVEELRRLVQEEGFRAVKLHSNMHLYRPDLSPDFMNPVVEASLDLKIPVFVHTGDPPYSIPSQFLSTAEAYPDAKFVFFHFGIQYSGFPYEAMHIARKTPNVYLEISWAPLPRIREAIRMIGADRLIYGTDCPAMEEGVPIRQIDALCGEPPIGMNLPSEDRDKILGGNIATLLRLDPAKYA